MLEKQWELPFDDDNHAMAIGLAEDDDDTSKATVVVARSSVSARQRRMSGRRRGRTKNGAAHFAVSPELIQSRNRIYLRGTVSKELLTHKQVVHLSHKIKDGIWLQQQRSKYASIATHCKYEMINPSFELSFPLKNIETVQVYCLHFIVSLSFGVKID
jgi:RNA polymerase primary sigma factor